MRDDDSVKKENLLQALNHVPFISTTPEGSISLQGGNSYKLYVNGRPWDAATQEPEMVLRTIKAKDVLRVDIITGESKQYGNNSVAIINIVIEEAALKGLRGSIGGAGGTRPEAGANGILTCNFNKVDLNLSYDYSYTGQRHQRMKKTTSFISDLKNNGLYSDLRLPEADGLSEYKVLSEGEGSGNWHVNTLRFMLNWSLDSLNSIYADVHGRLTKTNTSNSWEHNGVLIDGSKLCNSFIIDDNNSAGYLESNVIWRNYYSPSNSMERWRVGYRYTYNPDKRHYSLSSFQDKDAFPDVQRTDGGLNSHSFFGGYYLLVNGNQTFDFYLRNDYRNLHSHSYRLWDNNLISGGSRESVMLDYINNITSANILYNLYLRNLSLYAGVRGEYSYLSYTLDNGISDHASNKDFYLFPQAGLSWRASLNTNVRVRYGMNIRRPNIVQLVPFEFYGDYLSTSDGNYALCPSLSQDFEASVYQSVGKIFLYFSGEFSFTKDYISQYSVAYGNSILSSYLNIPKVLQGGLNMNLSYSPKRWIDLSVYANLKGRKVGGCDNVSERSDWEYNISPYISFYLPAQWIVSMNYGLYKQLPAMNVENKPFSLYSLRVNKSFLNGMLNIGLRADNFFSSHIHLRNITTVDGITNTMNHYLTGRTISISLSYAFRSGKHRDLERDHTLKASDLNTGVD